ncbi:cytochrome c1 [Aquisediminimonas profunda]|uniref:cytochrome c1 n=1 Tax=Aquisediminimonas profunda TaxID=1550733 RepID=UPI001C6294A0|nr:cytochrome c1 [Aquisediminimonas profunda]
MIRIIAFLGGLGFVAALLVAALMPREATEKSVSERFHKEPKEVSFTTDGPLGKFDHAQLQRGFQVYKEVCSACHSLRLVSFGDLTGIGYTPGQIKTIAAEWTQEQPTINPDTGEAATRKNLPSDKFPPPFANETAARAANNNAAPPDLSLMAKAREGGPAYIYSLLTGFQDPPANLPKDSLPGPGLHYNPYFANLNLSMAPPLVSDGQVTYGEGSPKPTVDQMAKDVSTFLIWTAEPKLEQRHRAGIAAIVFLLIFAGLCWGSYQAIWANKEH